ncbi:MAG: hypothetical protein WCG23_01555 [bacterium]
MNVKSKRMGFADDLTNDEKELNLLLMPVGVKNIMQELKFRNYTPSLFAFLAAVALSVGSSNINISPFGLPIPLLIIGLILGYLVLALIAYPKATTIQIIQLSITGVFLSTLVLVAAVYGIKYFNLAFISLNSEFIILINPLTPALSFFFGFITLISIVRFEEKSLENKKVQNKNEKQLENNVEAAQPEIISFEGVKIAEPTKPIINKIEEAIAEKPESLYQKLYPQAKNESQNTQESQSKEVFFRLNEDEVRTETDINKEKILIATDEIVELESLPSIDFKEVSHENKISSLPSQEDDNEYFDFIPTDIRLVSAPVSKENDSKGKIAAIGKLLVNNRDIEGVIESSAAVAEGNAEGKTNIFSSACGEQIYEKFNKLKQEFNHIKEIALIDKGGFILASNQDNEKANSLQNSLCPPETLLYTGNQTMKMHITGALVAGAYHTLQNYLAQISFKNPQKIYFETENSNNFIIKTNDEFLFSICDKAFKHVDYTELGGFIENKLISESDLTPLVELNQIKNFAVSDGSGKLVKSTNKDEKSEKLAIISAALFENLKVFLMNMQLSKLTRITVFNSEEVITIQKFNDEISAFTTPADGLIKISDDFTKIEKIYHE